MWTAVSVQILIQA